VKQISISIIGLAGALAIAPAGAEDLTAGKTPAQLFRSDCGACHHSPNGLARDNDVRALAAFLVKHYTTKSESAAALAVYVAGLSGAGTSSRNRGPKSGRERSIGEGEAPTRAFAVPADDSSPAEEPVRRRRRTAVPDEGEAPRPPREIETNSANAESVEEAGKPAPPKARKRRHRAQDAQAKAKAEKSNTDTKSNTGAEAPPAASPPPSPGEGSQDRRPASPPEPQ
jgi:hypothetical protein